MGKDQRKHIRFEADPNTLVLLEFKNGQVVTGLALQEAFKGVGAIFIAHELIEKNTKAKIQVGELGPMDCTIRWVRALTDKVFEVGFEYDN